jgi:hypothetical protein
MNAELLSLRKELSGAREFLESARLVRASHPGRDVTDFYRAALAKVVSGYDRFVHQLVFRGMMEAAAGIRPQTPAFGRFKVSVLSALAAAQGQIVASWLGAEIANQHSIASFQRCDKVADAIRLISAAELWNTVSASISIAAADLRFQMDGIVDRRNQIVHEADIDPLTGVKRPITRKYTLTSIRLIQRVAREIDRIAG